MLILSNFSQVKFYLQYLGLVIFFSAQAARAQIVEVKPEYSILFYNTENFFDCENDTALSDQEFQINAERNWTPKRFHLKTERLAKVIVAAGKWNAPVLVGLCEIENRDVLETLVKTDPISKFRYKIVQKDSPDPRGIDVALLYRPDLFHPIDFETIPVVDPGNKEFRTRDILKVVGLIGRTDTLTVFVNHWPSRYGGLMETQEKRLLAASTLRKAITEVLSANPKAKVVCMGDFNDTPADQSLEKILRAKNPGSADKVDLINLSRDWMTDEIQTIKSKYKWEVFDQFIVSKGFANATNGMVFKNAEIFKGSFLLEKDIQYGGVKPKRTYLGFKYHNGFSDHLPVVLHFELSD